MHLAHCGLERPDYTAVFTTKCKLCVFMTLIGGVSDELFYFQTSNVIDNCRRGKIGRQIISTVFQYNHQHGSLNLPIEGLPRGVPIAIKVKLNGHPTPPHTTSPVPSPPPHCCLLPECICLCDPASMQDSAAMIHDQSSSVLLTAGAHCSSHSHTACDTTDW